LKIEPIYINEEPSNRYTCEFTKIKEQEKERRKRKSRRNIKRINEKAFLSDTITK